MALYSGQNGELLINDAKAAKVRSWSFTHNQTVIETVSLADTDRTIIPGLKSLSGSCSLFYYQASAGSGGDVSTLVSATMDRVSGSGGATVTDASNQVKFKLRIDDSSATGRYVEFYAWLTSIAMTCSQGEVFSADVGFEANGAPVGLVL